MIAYSPSCEMCLHGRCCNGCGDGREGLDISPVLSSIDTNKYTSEILKLLLVLSEIDGFIDR